MPPCSPAQSGTAAAAPVVIVQHPCTRHRSQTAGLGTQQTLLSFCSSSNGRAAQWELGVHQGQKEPSFSSHQTTPTAHPQP